MTFAEMLEQLRDRKGWSEARLAEECGVPLGALHAYGLKRGAGRRRPSFAAVVKIARALGVDCTAFADCGDVFTDPETPERKRGKNTAKRKQPGR